MPRRRPHIGPASGCAAGDEAARARLTVVVFTFLFHASSMAACRRNGVAISTELQCS
ncbi:hypothetical protein OH687_36400 [Burkholderia anthina]|nr:hypothetical protein OH687_36400 [Burkholderia anthina]